MRGKTSDEGEGGLGRRSGSRPAVSTAPPANSSNSIRHGRLLPRSLSTGWSAFKAAQKAAWSLLWLLSSTGGQLRAVTSSPPGSSFTRFAHAPPVDLAHSTTHRRLRPRRLQGALRARNASSALAAMMILVSSHVELMSPFAAANPRHENTSSSTARSTSSRARFSSPPSGSNRSPSPTSSATRVRQRRRSVSSPTRAASTRFIARPRRICLVEFPHP